MGASTGRPPTRPRGHSSDLVLKPVFSCPPDPIRGGDDILVLCEVLNIDLTPPHTSNTRAALVEVAERFAAQEPIFGIEQEYTFFDGSRPLGFPPEGGFPAPPQGGYYCGVGADEIFGRDIVEKHLDNCLQAGLGISGINAEVMPRPVGVPGRPARPPAGGRRPAVGGPLAAVPHRRGLRCLRHPRPQAGQGRLERRRRTPTSPPSDARGYDAIITACEALGEGSKPLDHVKNYGAGIDDRLTGLHETARGTSTPTASPTAAPPSASPPGRWRRTARATSRTAAPPTPTSTPPTW